MKLALGPLGRLEDGAGRQRTRERNIMKAAKMCPDPRAEHFQFVVLLSSQTPNCRVRCCEDANSSFHRTSFRLV
jgi:hypothetical protein